jgi:hypothetical protein
MIPPYDPYDQSSMKFLLIPCRPLVPRCLLAATAALLIAGIAGCASPRLPQPPSLSLPEPVKDLTAERVGDLVQLHWTTPSMTTDRLEIQGAMTAEICRITVTSPAPQPQSCIPVTRQQVQSGPTQAAEALSPTLTADPPVLLAYRVQIFNSHGRSAGLSPEAFTASGIAPPPVDQLRATPTRDGAMLEWQKTDSPTPVELDRLPVGPNGVVIEPTPHKTPSKPSKPTLKKTESHTQKSTTAPAPKPLKPQMTPPAPIEVKLQTPPLPADSGGTIDNTAQKGETYRYTAQRVRSVSLGGHALELRSNVSLPVTVAMRDIFPPHAPSGLEAVPGGATAADRSIDLSWTPNTEDDLAGYIVYRQEIDSKGVAAGTVTRLNATLVVGPAYRDLTAIAGRRYAYRVTAIDTAGNESAPSADVQETLREQ